MILHWVLQKCFIQCVWCIAWVDVRCKSWSYSLTCLSKISFFSKIQSITSYALYCHHSIVAWHVLAWMCQKTLILIKTNDNPTALWSCEKTVQSAGWLTCESQSTTLLFDHPFLLWKLFHESQSIQGTTMCWPLSKAFVMVLSMVLAFVFLMRWSCRFSSSRARKCSDSCMNHFIHYACLVSKTSFDTFSRRHDNMHVIWVCLPPFTRLPCLYKRSWMETRKLTFIHSLLGCWEDIMSLAQTIASINK